MNGELAHLEEAWEDHRRRRLQDPGPRSTRRGYIGVLTAAALLVLRFERFRIDAWSRGDPDPELLPLLLIASGGVS